MIKSNKGEVTLNGDNFELEMDLALIVHTFIDCNKEYGVDFMKERIMKAVEMGFKSDKEIAKEVNISIRKSLEDNGFAKGLVELITILGGGFNGSK